MSGVAAPVAGAGRSPRASLPPDLDDPADGLVGEAEPDELERILARRPGARYWIEYAVYRRLRRWVLGRSLEASDRLGRRIGAVGWRLMARPRRLALDNLARALPELGDDERRRVARRCFEEWGATFVQSATADRFTARDLEERFECRGWEHMEAVRASGRGAFIMSAHWGRFELALYPLGYRLGDLKVVVRPPSNPLVAADLQRVRERFGVRTLPRRGVGRKVFHAVRSGGVVAIAVDQRVHPKQGILVPFFGREAWTTPLVAMLSRRAGVPVLPLSCEPLGGEGEPVRYRLEIGEPIEPRPGEDNEALTRRYMETLEELIRRRPEMWLWMHRRWALE